MLVLERVRVLVRGRDLVNRPERRVALDDVKGAVGRVVIGGDLLRIQLEQERSKVCIRREQAESLEEALLRGAPLGRRVLVGGRGQVALEGVPRDHLVRDILGRLELADRWHLRNDRVDLRGDGGIHRRRGTGRS